MSERGRRDGELPPPPPPLRTAAVDTHCHLDLMGVDVAQALADAAAVGITRVVTIGVDVESSRVAADQAAAHAGVVAAAGIHPNSAGAATPDALAAIAEFAARPEVRAVGETGLDFYRDTATKEDQQRAFAAHIAIAKETGKALVVHDRDAHGAVLAALEREGAPDRVVFHCFSGDADMARVCAERGFYLSYAGNVTFKNAEVLRAAAAVTPIGRLLVETDAPYLTPVPHRGRPNAPYLVPFTVRALAAVKQVDEDALAAAVDRNATEVFGSW